MKEAPGLLVLHCPAGGGHKAAANAVAEAARDRGIAASVEDALAFTPRWFAEAYVAAHLTSTSHVPSLYGLGYAAYDRRNERRDDARVFAALDHALGKRLVERVRRERPLAVVATHFFAMAILGRAKREGLIDVPLVGVVTDYTAHAFWAVSGVDRFCVASGRAPREAESRNGVDPFAVVATGIPVRRAFGDAPSWRAPSKDERLEVLVTSGGFGVGPMIETLRGFSGTRDRVHLTVVCGDNDERVRRARDVCERAGLDAAVIGFERDMPKRMAEAHVLVGKPGGLTVSESLAAGRPMVLVGACPGQEMANQEWLVDHGAAVVASPRHAAIVINALSSNQLTAMASNALALAAPNAAQRVLDVALRLTDVTRCAA